MFVIVTEVVGRGSVRWRRAPEDGPRAILHDRLRQALERTAARVVHQHAQELRRAGTARRRGEVPADDRERNP